MGEDVPTAFEVNQQNLAEVLVSGRKLADIMSDASWGQMEVSGGSGTAILNRVNPSSAELTVVSSEDPVLKAGEVIVIDGATLSGGLTAPGVIAPSTRLAIRRQVKQRYKLGDHNSRDTLTATEIESASSSGNNMYRKTEDGGLEVVVFDPTPLATGFISHAALVHKSEDGEDRTRYLF